jgi:hypothetical protein
MVRRRLDSGLVRFALEKWAAFEAECRAALVVGDSETHIKQT